MDRWQRQHDTSWQTPHFLTLQVRLHCPTACSFARWRHWGSFPMSVALFLAQKSAPEMTNMSLYVVFQVAVAACLFNHFSPLSPVRRPVCVMASFCFFLFFLHAPFHMVSISCHSSSSSSCCRLFFFSFVSNINNVLSSGERAWTCGAAAVLNAPLVLPHLTDQNVLVPMALLVTKRKRNYSNEAYAGLGIIHSG